MKIPSLKEIIDTVRDQEAERQAIEFEELKEKYTPKDLAFANREIGLWVKKYRRKNSKDSARIRSVEQSIYDKQNNFFRRSFNLQLFVNGVLVEDHPIIEEAFDSISRRPIETTDHPPHTFHLLYSFNSNAKK